MVKIQAFRGYVAAQALASRLISPAYDVLNSEEARHMSQDNEYSFLHVNKPEIDLPPSTDLYSDTVYQKERENLVKFIENQWLLQEAESLLYIYATTLTGQTQYGIVACSSVEDYTNNRIKKHELTRKKKEADRTKLTDVQGANAGPVFLTYPADDRVDSIVQIVTSRGPWIDVEADDGVRHSLWKMNVAESGEIVQAFEGVAHTYIADGHHRAASAFNVGVLRKELCVSSGQQPAGTEDFNFFLSILYPHNQLRIFDYNRVLKGLNGKSPEQFIEELKESFELYEVETPEPPAKHHFSLFLSGKWTGMKVKEGKILGEDPVSTLDSHLLSELCLKPILGIQDITTDENIDFVGGIRGLQELERRCGSDCVAAIAMFPIEVADVMAIADAGQIMPPKSTWFEPKPRSGMVVRVFEN